MHGKREGNKLRENQRDTGDWVGADGPPPSLEPERWSPSASHWQAAVAGFRRMGPCAWVGRRQSQGDARPARRGMAAAAASNRKRVWLREGGTTARVQRRAPPSLQFGTTMGEIEYGWEEQGERDCFFRRLFFSCLFHLRGNSVNI